MTLVHRVFVAGAALGLGFAALGCTTTTSIRPDQLPILTNAAGTPAREPPEVIGASGKTVEVDGTLEGVEVTLGLRPSVVRTFNAPVASEIRGPTLFVRDDERSSAFPLPWTEEVKVIYANKTAQLAGGVVLDILGGTVLVGGAVVFFAGLADTHREFPGIVISLAIGLPLLAVGTGMLVPGIALTQKGAHKPKYPPRPVSRVTAGPGSIRVRF